MNFNHNKIGFHQMMKIIEVWFSDTRSLFSEVQGVSELKIILTFAYCFLQTIVLGDGKNTALSYLQGCMNYVLLLL